MTTHQIFLSLVADAEYTLACDVWWSNLLGSSGDSFNRFRDVRERLGDEAAALNVADAIEDAA